MKKLISLMLALCLLCTVAVAEATEVYPFGSLSMQLPEDWALTEYEEDISDYYVFSRDEDIVGLINFGWEDVMQEFEGDEELELLLSGENWEAAAVLRNAILAEFEAEGLEVVIPDGVCLQESGAYVLEPVRFSFNGYRGAMHVLGDESTALIAVWASPVEDTEEPDVLGWFGFEEEALEFIGMENSVQGIEI